MHTSKYCISGRFCTYTLDVFPDVFVVFIYFLFHYKDRFYDISCVADLVCILEPFKGEQHIP